MWRGFAVYQEIMDKIIPTLGVLFVLAWVFERMVFKFI